MISEDKEEEDYPVNDQAKGDKRKAHFMYSDEAPPPLFKAASTFQEKQRFLIDDLKDEMILEEKTFENDSFDENDVLRKKKVLQEEEDGSP